ncbi:MAG: ABC transporter permease [Methylococcales bacterium]
MTWVVIAIRNLLNNGRRSLFTIVAIMLGYAAVILFDGFTGYMYTGIKESVIFAQGSGHLTVFKSGFLEKGKLHPERYLIGKEEVETLQRISEKMDNILVLAPELHINGLISNGQISTVFVAAGRVPSQLARMKSQAKSRLASAKYYQGEPLSDADIYGVGVGSILAEMMGFSAGSAEAVVIAPTVDGEMNALDARIKQTIGAGNEVLDDKMMLVTLAFAQRLYDTDAVDRVRILLRDEQLLPETVQALERAFAAQDLDLEIKKWIELSPFYIKVRNMFEVIFVFVFVIVITVVAMSIINTLGMAIMERTREIGTLRAMGINRFGVIRLFVIESSILVLIGAALGLAIAVIVCFLIDLLQVTWVPPQVSVAVPLEIELLAGHMLVVFLFLELLAVLAAFFPARRAAFQTIVDALGHV